jgi:hypothetical protein
MMAERVHGAIAYLSASASNASDKVTEIFIFMRVSFEIGGIIVLPDYSMADETVTSM